MNDRIPLDELTSDQLDALYERLEEAEADRDINLKNLENYRGTHLNLQHDYHHALNDVYAMQRVRKVARHWGIIDTPESVFPDMQAAIGARDACRGRGHCQWMEAGGIEERLERALAEITTLTAVCQSNKRAYAGAIQDNEQLQHRLEVAQQNATHATDEARETRGMLAAATVKIKELQRHLHYTLNYDGLPHRHLVLGHWDADGRPCGHCARLAAARSLATPQEENT